MEGSAQGMPEKLLRDVRVVVHDAEDLIKATAGDFGDKTREARAKLAGALVVARETCNTFEDRIVVQARAADHLVRDHPYEAIGIAFALGLLGGILLCRSNR
jgi:ElaB/YqjD/DUF883 family membrane-anchored ribosome-binding protein